MIAGYKGMPWWEKGACLDLDPDLFTLTDKRGRKKISSKERQALQACHSCPVRPDCLADALAAKRPTTGVIRAAYFWPLRDPRNKLLIGGNNHDHQASVQGTGGTQGARALGRS